MHETIMDGFEAYIRTELCLAKETLSAYTRDVQEFIDFIGKQELTAQSVENFVSHLCRCGKKPTTVRRKCMSVRCLYRHLISLGLLDPNTLDMIDSVRVDRRMPDALDAQAVDMLVATVEKRLPVYRTVNVRRDVAIILTLYHSGLRVSELCDLSLPCVNLSNRSIRVVGKGGRERIIPTTRRCVEAIKTYVDLDRQSDTNIVFVQSSGQQMTRRVVSNMLTSVARKAGVQHTTAHMLRRSCATSLMNNGVDLELVQAMLGHQHLSTTQRYLAISQDRLTEVCQRCHPFGEKYES